MPAEPASVAEPVAPEPPPWIAEPGRPPRLGQAVHVNTGAASARCEVGVVVSVFKIDSATPEAVLRVALPPMARGRTPVVDVTFRDPGLPIPPHKIVAMPTWHPVALHVPGVAVAPAPTLPRPTPTGGYVQPGDLVHVWSPLNGGVCRPAVLVASLGDGLFTVADLASPSTTVRRRANPDPRPSEVGREWQADPETVHGVLRCVHRR